MNSGNFTVKATRVRMKARMIKWKKIAFRFGNCCVWWDERARLCDQWGQEIAIQGWKRKKISKYFTITKQKGKKVEDKTDNFSFSEFWDVEIVKPLEFDEKKRRQRLAVFILMEMC